MEAVAKEEVTESVETGILNATKKAVEAMAEVANLAAKKAVEAKAEEAVEAMVEVTNLAAKKAVEAKAEEAAEAREAMDVVKAGEAGIINTTSINVTKKAV